MFQNFWKIYGQLFQRHKIFRNFPKKICLKFKKKKNCKDFLLSENFDIFSKKSLENLNFFWNIENSVRNLQKNWRIENFAKIFRNKICKFKSSLQKCRQKSFFGKFLNFNFFCKKKFCPSSSSLPKALRSRSLTIQFLFSPHNKKTPFSPGNYPSSHVAFLTVPLRNILQFYRPKSNLLYTRRQIIWKKKTEK